MNGVIKATDEHGSVEYARYLRGKKVEIIDEETFKNHNQTADLKRLYRQLKAWQAQKPAEVHEKSVSIDLSYGFDHFEDDETVDEHGEQGNRLTVQEKLQAFAVPRHPSLCTAQGAK